MSTISENTKRVLARAPLVITATTSSELVLDTAGFDGVMYTVPVGALDFTTTDETYVAAVFESAASNGSGAVAIAGATVPFTVGSVEKTIQISGLGTGSRLRYQFLRFTLAGTTPSLAVAAVAVFSKSAGQLNPTDVPEASV